MKPYGVKIYEMADSHKYDIRKYASSGKFGRCPFGGRPRKSFYKAAKARERQFLQHQHNNIYEKES